ncbi:uncharacterized protein [Cicer arietinum]
MEIVGESVKKFYSDVMQEILPQSSFSAPVMSVEQYTGAGLTKKSFQASREITIRAYTEQSTENSSVNHDIGNDAVYAESCGKQCVESAEVKSNLSSDENQQNMKMVASNTTTEVALSKTDTCISSQSCEIANVNQNHEATVSKTDYAEVTNFASVEDCCNESENASTEQNSNAMELVESTEENEINTSYFSSDAFEDAHELSTIGAMQLDDCSHSTITVSHPESSSLDIENFDAAMEKDHKIIHQDDELQFDETCVMITKDEYQSVPEAIVNLKTSKKKWRQPFSLSKKSARKQEYEELALLTFVEHKQKSSAADISESEWELL